MSLRQMLDPLVCQVTLLFLITGCHPAEGSAKLAPARPAPEMVAGQRVAVGGLPLRIDSAVASKMPVVVRELETELQAWARPVGTQPKYFAVRLASSPCNASPPVCDALARPEGYWLQVGADSVVAVASDVMGLVHAITRFEVLAEKDSGNVPVTSVVDWPRLRVRGFHFVAEGLSLADADRLVRSARRAGYNTIIVQIADIASFLGLPVNASKMKWSVQRLASLADYVRGNALAFVPELKLLTHQEKFFAKVRPDLLFNQATYDPRNPETYKVVFSVLDTVIVRMKPAAIHIGHDEVVGTGAPGAAGATRLPAGQRPLPARLFLDDVRRIHTYLADRHVPTWMWGDMLISEGEFPGMFPNNLHGTPQYVALRDSIPTDIVICDWHYFGANSRFPTASAFADAGHDVLGATWRNERVIDAFSRYIMDMPRDGLGMIATTWFYVQRHQWTVVDSIMAYSAQRFWNPSGGSRVD